MRYRMSKYGIQRLKMWPTKGCRRTVLSDDDDRAGERLGVNKALHDRVEPVAQRGREAEVLWCRCLEGCTVNYAPSGAARIRRLATVFDCLIALGACAPCLI